MAQTPVAAQQPPVHYHHAGALPPGAIGTQQLLRGGPLPGYFQPVEIRAPEGTLISLAVNNVFGEPQASPVTVGMMIAPVYRLRITRIPFREGFEVYPTIEVVDRLYPPVGLEGKFPIPVEITAEEIELALEGKFITRVIYLENPDDALPIAQDPGRQSWFEIQPHQNPLVMADQLGRPMAILRIGGRVPDAVDGPDAAFMFGSPPFLKFSRPSVPPAAAAVPPVLPNANREVAP